jgi:hypothetical protein
MKMKAVFLSLLLVGCLGAASAQDYSKLDSIQLTEKADFARNESLVLECSNYLLSSPIKLVADDANHLKALQLVIRWMEGTNDYSFNIDESIGKLVEENQTILNIYMACMTKFVLENKDKAKDDAAVKYGSFLLLASYCEDSSKGVKQGNEVANLVTAKNNNTLRQYLGME